MPNVDIYDRVNHEWIARDMPAGGITDALVCHFFPNGSGAFYDQEVYDACRRVGEAWVRNEPTEEHEAFLGITIS